MKPAIRLKAVLPGLHSWSSFHREWKVDFTSHAVQTAKGVVFIDPMKPGPAILAKLTALGEPLAVLLTNANHGRDADWFRKHFGVQVYAHPKAKSDCDAKIDVPVMDGEKLPGGLEAIYLPGAVDGECAFFSRAEGSTLIVGDILLNPKGKGLSILPEQYCDDHREARRSLRRLRDLTFKAMVFSHGEPITANARRQFLALLKQSGKQST
jgi:glyoxylase-like metal-dependent hydrolase (beta-lactamase superfamily II)